MSELILPTDEERGMLRDSIRGLLESYWPMPQAVTNSADAQAAQAIWTRLVAQGLASLGMDPSEGGLREIAIVMEELGRAACPAPLLEAALANLAFAGQASRSASAASLLKALHDGQARIAFAFGRFDADASAGAVTCVTRSGQRLSGTLRCVGGADTATHLCVALDEGPGIAIVACLAPAVAVARSRAMGSGGLCEVTLFDAPASIVAVPRSRIEDLARIARLCACARAQGAARRAFEVAVDYAKERHQFGQPVGKFQAVQHKLANCLISLEGVRLTIANAAAAFDRGSDDWRYFAAAAFAFGSGALRQVSLETHHALGAIGYAEEHEAPRHFRRVHLDTVGFGGAWQARREVAAHLLDRAEGGLPRYDLGDAGNAFRESVREWLASHWTAERRAAFASDPEEHREFDASFALDLGKTGWIGLGWPVEHGGQARTPLEQLAFIEEMERVEAPRAGAAVQANALMMHGTPQQQARWLPEILAGQAMHGMGYSEPGAGSDLAALRTKATRDGDEWVINGQKIWTTTWWGKYMFLAARTDPDARPSHAGISMFVVPMDAPGIQIKPAKTMYDGTFANIFYDDVRVAADAMIGKVNGGWKVLTDALAAERGLIGGGIVMKVAQTFELLCDYVRHAHADGVPLGADPLVRDRIATLAAEIEVGRQLMVHCAELALDGTTPPEYGAISKVFSGELMERFGEAALDIIGMRATLSHSAPGAIANGKFEQSLRHSLMWVISIGTNEIQRSLIAQRGLGLPR